jgi:branched-chain amino acid transport system ATP-binding protein
MILEVNNLTKAFGGLVAVNSLNLSIHEGEIVGLIGPNGAGKTTFFNCIAGHLRPEAGSISFEGEDITGRRPEQICLRGIARTFQSAKTFGHMSVVDNVMVGAFAHTRNRKKSKEIALKCLDIVGLASRADDLAGDLTIGVRKKLEISRALATGPRLLLLDEVMAGLNQTEVLQMISLIREINRQGITLFIIEHIMAVIMELSQRVVVIHHGEKLVEGTPQEVSQNPFVIKAYLGEESPNA